MAQASTTNYLGVVDTRKSYASGSTGTSAETAVSYNSVATMRARLAAINGTYYTSARLDQMTDNDMMYAIRLADDAAGF